MGSVGGIHPRRSYCGPSMLRAIGYIAGHIRYPWRSLGPRTIRPLGYPRPREGKNSMTHYILLFFHPHSLSFPCEGTTVHDL